MSRKTVQATKISASWTPSSSTAAAMEAIAFGAGKLSISGGRLHVTGAVAIDMADPDQAARVAARVKDYRTTLEALGTVHSFIVRTGAVPAGEVEYLPDPRPLPMQLVDPDEARANDEARMQGADNTAPAI